MNKSSEEYGVLLHLRFILSQAEINLESMSVNKWHAAIDVKASRKLPCLLKEGIMSSLHCLPQRQQKVNGLDHYSCK